MPRSTISGTAIDLDGKEMILDADQDTTITADTGTRRRSTTPRTARTSASRRPTRRHSPP